MKVSAIAVQLFVLMQLVVSKFTIQFTFPLALWDAKTKGFDWKKEISFWIAMNSITKYHEMIRNNGRGINALHRQANILSRRRKFFQFTFQKKKCFLQIKN